MERTFEGSILNAEHDTYAPDVQKAAPNGAAFNSCTCHWPPESSAGGYPPHLSQIFRPVVPVSGPLLAVALAGACCFWRAVYGSRYITGTLLVCNRRAVLIAYCFQVFTGFEEPRVFGFWNYKRRIILKTIKLGLIAGTEGKNAFLAPPE